MVNKDLLRQAICDGAFGNVQEGKTPQGQPFRMARITPEVLANVAKMPDDVINATLTLYVKDKTDMLNKQLADAQARVDSIRTQLKGIG